MELEHALTANPGIVKSVGLYKVMGDAVQAVVGGVYHQFVRPFPHADTLRLKYSVCDHQRRVNHIRVDL